MPELLLGANLPWLDYGQDFGASAWRPAGGVARPDQRQRMRRALGGLAEAGASVVRWWLLGDGRAGLRESPSGRQVSLDERLFEDLDAALLALRETGLRVVFVLLDFLWFAAGRLEGGVQLGGRRHLVRDEALRDGLLSGVAAPLAARYGHEPLILAWDLLNEPEWATFALGTLDPRASVSRRQMRALLAGLVAEFHRHATQPLTVGLARARSLPFVRGLGLDLYQVHWYERQEPVATLARPVLSLRLDRPLLLGEFATRGASVSSDAVVDIARQAGYAGALAWSWLATDDATDPAACRATLARSAV
ncbi:MAG TPA: hypothetical protein VMX54_14875 [Vicinamibacteria bacterium]|nr:hypothetical protein [Vicinamibacteria bacterium]